MPPLLVLAFCLFGTALAIPRPFNYATGDEIQGYDSGSINDGKWSCPWYLDGFDCHDGEFTCTCPGDGANAKFKIGCCYVFPSCGKICHKGTNCGRYKNCQKCRSGIGEWDTNACTSCQPGFSLGIGDCRTDIDECLYKNGGCEHTCVNTYGSYHCTCNNGYQLAGDKHMCKRLSCGEPGALGDGIVTPTDNWMHGSYAKYSCASDSLSLVGESVRLCTGEGAKVWWDGEAPQCRDTCQLIAAKDRKQCGTGTMTRDKCQQLGCCYAEANGVPSCFHNTALAFIKYSGERPGDGNGAFTQEQSTVDGCAYQCMTGVGGAECKSFGIRRTGNNPEHGVSFQNCHLLEKTRNEYSDGREIRTDNNYDLYDFITFHKQDAAYSNVESKLSEDDQRAQEKMYTGCYLEKKDNPDLPYHVLTSGSDMTVGKCLATCRRQGFTFAGLQNGIECFCGNSVARKHGVATDCKEPCSGDWNQVCGGSSSNSVYHVPHDSRYLGCYEDKKDVHDMSVKLWDEKSGFSAEDCMEQCALKDFEYAGVQKGGACYCGNVYGNHGGANETSCHLKCDGWGRQNCGGESQNAVYRSEAPFDLNSGGMTSTVVKAYDESGAVTGISTRLFTLAPGLRSIITKKLVIHSSEEVETPYDDEACEQGCYTTCGELYQTEDFDEIGEIIHIRFFHLRLSDLHRYTGKYAKSVYVYAQTVVIDTDVDVDYSLLIRTRQLIIDRKRSLTISVPSSAPDLDMDVSASMYNGPEPDVLYLKQSFMCARILFESREPQNVNLGWKMVTDLAHYYGKHPEPLAYTGSVRTFNAKLRGIDRADLHYVPFYTKGHIAQILATYHDKISLYKKDLDRLYDQTLTQSEFLDVAENLQKIYTDTDVAEAKNAYETSMDAVVISNTTYYRMKEQYEVSRIKLDEAHVEFEKGLEEYLAWAIVKAVFNFAIAVSKVVVGIIDFDTGDLYDSVDKTVGDAQAMVDSLQIISYSVYQTDSLSRMADDIFDRLAKSEGAAESLKYVDDLELAIAVQVDLIHWENLKNYAEIMMSDDMVSKIKGAAEYKAALMDTANWGSAMTRSMIEKSEVLRLATQSKFLYLSKQEQQARVDQVFVDARKGLADKEAMMAAIIEQTYDIRMDLNECLEMFCQAYFYENLYECKDSYKPKFGGELNDLLLQINAARRDDLLVGDAPSTASRILTIKDEDTDPECNDAITCPVNYFRRNRVFYYRLGVHHKDLVDLDKYKVAEIILDFVGAKASETNSYLKMRIEATGEFQSKSRNQVYNFVSKPLSLAFEYDVITGHISLRADVYTPYRNMVNHITPFTTWTMRVADERSENIDVSNVSSIRLRLDGSAVNAVTLAQCSEEMPCPQQFDNEEQ